MWAGSRETSKEWLVFQDLLPLVLTGMLRVGWVALGECLPREGDWAKAMSFGRGI